MAGEKILDIDDSPTVQRLIEMILSSQGYQVVLASDGEEGIAKARSERPAVILVDFVMPKMNGFQVCKTLKDDPGFKDTPIILVTSKGDKVGSKFVDVLGITEYFTKPFQPEELLAKIREVIDKRKTSPPKPVQEAPRASVREPSVQSRPGLPSDPPHPAPPAPPAAGGLEATVRSIVEQILGEFVRNTLPDLIRKEMVSPQHAVNSDFRGDLASYRITEVLQTLGQQRQTGRLVIHQSGDTVGVYFRDGRVVFASSNRGGDSAAVDELLNKTCKIGHPGLLHAKRIASMTSQPIDQVLVKERMIDPGTFAQCLRRHTESAVFKGMTWTEGEFFFEKAAPPAFANALKLKVEDLLVEGARRADEWGVIRQKIPHFDLVFEPVIANAEELATRGMSDADLRVFSSIDGRRTVQEVIDILGNDDFETAKRVFILLSANLIRRRL